MSRIFRVLAGILPRHIGTRALAATGVIGVLLNMVVVMTPAPVSAAINSQINFQGKLVNSNGTNIPDGTYNMQFKLYTGGDGCVSGGSSPCSGTLQWTESRLRNASQGVTVNDGIFQVNLGAVTSLPAIFNNDTIWLSINLGNTNASCTPFTNCAGDGEMLPFIRFTATPYALNSDLLDGLDSNAFAQLNPASAQSGSLNVTGSVQAATSLQAPLVDTASAVALNVGTGTASSVTVGRATSSTNLTLQGSASTSWSATGASGSTTVNFANPTAANTITFPNAGGTVCTTTASTCSATYQVASATGYLFKNAQDTSTASVAGALLAFSNTNTGSSATALSLTNAGTAAALRVTQSANPGAGEAVLLVNNTNGTPSGNLIDLQTNGTSRFAVSAAGAVTAGTYNGQTITSAASFTGTVTTANTLTVSSGGFAVTGNSTLSGSLGQTFTGSGDAHTITANSLTTGAGLKVTSSNNTAANTSWSAISLNPTNAQGTTAVSGANLISGLDVQFTQAPTVNSNNETVANLEVKQNDSSTADNTVSSILHLANRDTVTGNLITVADGIKIDGANVSNGINFSGTFNTNLITSTNFSVSQGGAIVGVGVNSGTGLLQGTGGLTVSGAVANINANSNFATNINTGTSTGTLTIGGGSAPLVIDSTNFDVSSAGALSGITTINTSGLVTIGGGGLNVTGGIDNNTGGITEAGAISGATNVSLNGTISGGTTYTASTALQAPVLDTAGAAGLAIGGANATSLTLGATDIAFTLQGTSGASGSKITATSGGNTTTVRFIDPTATRTIEFPNDSGTVCLQGSTACGFAVGTFLAKNAQDTSTASVAGALYTFTNSNTGSASVLSLSNAGTAAALSVTQSTNPSAGQAVLLVNNSNGTPSGNLLDLQTGGSSRFAVTSAGAVTTSSTINGQTISSAANFTGTVTAASTVTVSAGGLAVTGNSTIAGTLGGLTGLTVVSGGASITGGIDNNSGGITEAGAVSGATTIDANNKLTLSGTGANQLAVTGAPTNSATSSLIQIGSAIAGGNAVANGGTYIGLNAPGSGAGSAADFLNFQVNGTSALRVTNAGNVTAGTYNGQTISSAASFTGTVTAASTLTVSAGGLAVTGNSTITGTLGGLTGLTVVSGGASITGGLNNNGGGITNAGVISGASNIGLTGTISGGTTYTASTALQAPTIDTAGAVSMNIATQNAADVTIGQTDINFVLQGASGTTGSKITATSGANTTTLTFADPTATRSVVIPNESGTICLQSSTACGFLTTTSGLAKNPTTTETSTSSINGSQYSFSNTNTGSSARALALSNAGTGSTLQVTTDNNPGAGNAVIFASNTNATPGGNLLDLQAGSSPTSRLSVAASGSLTTAGNLTVNGTGSNTFSGQLVVSNVATDITTGTNEDLTMVANGTGQVILNDLVQAPTLGSADTTTLLCRNTSNQIATCSATLNGSAFVQGGNTFGAVGDLGTNDAFGLNIRTNNATRLTVSTTGSLTWAAGSAGNFDHSTSTGTFATGSGAVSINGDTTVASGKTFTVQGTSLFQAAANSTSSFNIKTAGPGNNNLFTVDSQNSRVGIALGGNNTPASTLEVAGTLRLSGSNTENFTTPVGSSVPTKINIPIFDPGANGQILAFGLPSGAGASARAISLFDARTGAHQPTIGVFSPDENSLFGFTWDGSDATANVKTNDHATASTDGVALRSGNSAGTSETTGGVTVMSGHGTGTNTSSGSVTIDSGAKTGTGTAGTVTIGGTNASALTLGRTGLNTTVAANVTVQGTGANTFSGQLVMSAVATDITTGTNEDLTMVANGSGQIILNDTTQVATLGAGDSATYLCRNTSNQIATCSTTATGTAFVQGGNSFNATGVLGTNDGFDLTIRRGGTTQLTVGNGSVTLASGADLLLQGASAYISNPQNSFANGEAFGLNATVGTSTSSTAVGNGADATGSRAVVIGQGASATSGNSADDSVVIGSGASATNAGGIAIGSTATAAFDGLAIGYGATAGNASIALKGTTTASNQMVVGGSGTTINHVVVGNGVTSATPAGFLMQGTSGSGTDIAGANVTIAGGQSTGSGTGGNIVLQVSNTSGTGSGLNSLATIATVSYGGVTMAANKDLTLSSGTGRYVQTFTGTTTDALSVTASSLSTGAAMKVISANNTAANTSWSGVMLDVSNVQASTAVSGANLIAGLNLQFTQNASVSGNNETAANIAVKQIDTSVTDNTVSSILNLANNDTATGNQITATDGLKINGANVTNGINLSGTFGTNLITSTNFSVSQGGAIVGVGVNSGTGLIQGTGGLTVSGAVANVNVGSNFATNINTGGSTGTVTIGNGSAPLVIDSTAFDVSVTGALSGITTITTSGTINTNTFTGTGLTFGSAATATVQSAAGQTLQVGVTGNTLALKGDASTTLAATNGANTTTIGFVSPTANVVYNFGTASAGTYTVCTTVATSCSGAYIQNSTSQQTSANYNVDGQARIGTNLTLGGDSSGTAYGSGADLMFGNSANRTVKILAAASGNGGRTLTVQAGDGTGTNQAGGALVLQGGAATGTGAGGVVAVRSQTNSTTAFTVQNSSSVAAFTVNTTGSGNVVLIGDTTDGAIFGSTKELTLAGSARHARVVRLVAEYAGAVLDADGTNNTGTMTAAFDATQRTNYYRWTTGQASNQDYDVVINVPVPEDWAAWNGNPTMEVYESNASGSFTVTITKTDGTTDANWNALTVNPAAAAAWTTYNSTAIAATGYTAGGTMTVRVKMTAPPNQHMRLGTITFPYLSKW